MSWIQALAEVAGVATNAAVQGGQNRKARRFAREMFDKTNEYNSPTQQMARLREAGLNPHLVYNNGSGAAGVASSVAPVNQPAPQFDFGGAAMRYVANKKQQTEIDNLKKARDVMAADEQLKKAQAANQLSSSAKTDQEKAQAAEIWQTVVDQANANLSNTTLTGSKISADILKIQTDIKNTEAGTKLTNAKVTEVSQSIKESMQRIKLMQIDGQYKQAQTEAVLLENNLRRQGINPNDPSWLRILGQAAKDNDVVGSVKSFGGQVVDAVQDWFNSINKSRAERQRYLEKKYPKSYGK